MKKVSICCIAILFTFLPMSVFCESPQILTATIDLSDSLLPFFDNYEKLDLLLRYFASAKTWKVREDAGRAIIAFPSEQYAGSGNRNISYAYLEFCFEPSYPQKTNMYDESIGFHVEKKAGEWVSGLYVTGDHFYLSVHERSAVAERNFTRTTLKKLNEELSVIKEKGFSFSAETLPEGSIRLMPEPSIALSEGLFRGSYEVSGYVNPGEKGYLYLEIINSDSGENAIMPANRYRLIEHTGWSGNPAEKYYFSFIAFCDADISEIPFSAVFQVWFKPSDCSPARLVLQQKFDKVYYSE